MAVTDAPIYPSEEMAKGIREKTGIEAVMGTRNYCLKRLDSQAG
jgi:hypothetical protein